MTRILAIEGERRFPTTVGLDGRGHLVIPDDFPFEAGRESVLGIPVVSSYEFGQLRSGMLEYGGLGEVMFGASPHRLYTWCGIPVMHERDARIVKEAISIIESARKQWTGRPRDWSRAEAIFRALNGRDNHD